MKRPVNQTRVQLKGNQMQKFLDKMNNPTFSTQVSQILRTGNERRLAAFLKQKGFKL